MPVPVPPAPAPARTRAERPLPPADPALPALHELLAPPALHALLARTSPDVGISQLHVRSVDYDPGRSLAVTVQALANGQWHEVVVRAARGQDLRAVAAGAAADALCHLAAERSPAARAIAVDAETGALVSWLPADLALPLLAEPAGRLAALVGADLTFDPVVRTIAYRPGRSMVRATGDRVVKQHANPDEHAAALRGAEVARVAGVGAPPLLAELPTDRAIVLGRIGEAAPAGAALALATETGALAARLHALPAYGLPSRRPLVLLGAAAVATARATVIVPSLGRRTATALAALELQLPVTSRPVTCHGDLTVSNVCRTPVGAALCDFDELGAGAAAHDLATYAANRVSGRPGDFQAAMEVLDAICDGYGSRPPALEWHLAVAILRRTGTAFRNQKKDWPERTARLVTAAEQALLLTRAVR